MGLLRLLLKLFRPKRRRYRYQQSSHSYRPFSVLAQPAQQSPWEPLRQVEEATGQQVIRGHCWVIDGDTIVINKIHIRLAGIDAPEIDHPYGQNAKRALMNLCRGQVVTAITDGAMSYERAVATCTLDDGRDLSAEMVIAGLALDWGKHSGGRYRHLEVEGIRKKLWRVEARHKGRMPPKEKVGSDFSH
jgi:endonuclease YncB( thermonuclease family)